MRFGDDWKAYTKKDSHLKFHINLAMELMEQGIKLDWKTPYSGKKGANHLGSGKVMCPVLAKSASSAIQVKTTGNTTAQGRNHPSQQWIHPSSALRQDWQATW